MIDERKGRVSGVHPRLLPSTAMSVRIQYACAVSNTTQAQLWTSNKDWSDIKPVPNTRDHLSERFAFDALILVMTLTNQRLEGANLNISPYKSVTLRKISKYTFCDLNIASNLQYAFLGLNSTSTAEVSHNCLGCHLYNKHRGWKLT